MKPLGLICWPDTLASLDNILEPPRNLTRGWVAIYGSSQRRAETFFHSYLNHCSHFRHHNRYPDPALKTFNAADGLFVARRIWSTHIIRVSSSPSTGHFYGRTGHSSGDRYVKTTDGDSYDDQTRWLPEPRPGQESDLVSTSIANPCCCSLML